MAPKIGAPISTEKALRPENIPNRVPRSRMSFVITTIVSGVRETRPPVKNPKRMAKPIRPLVDLMAIQHSERIPDIVAAGMRMKKGPVLSAMRLGRIRPRKEPARMTERR